MFSELKTRYSFNKVPQTLSEMDFQKGAECIDGRFGNVVIDKVTIYPKGIVVDTRSSTDDAERVLEDILNWTRESLGATVQANRQHFVSQIVFHSAMHMAVLNPVLQRVADELTANVSRDLKHTFTVEPTAILFNVDTSQIKVAPAQFSIERRAEEPFSENTYFSNAPLRTADHLQLVKEFEASLLKPDAA